ncbi:MAG: hypothetical protein JW896_11000 [Deltaproteobacteria bacterium]|nr:hypothetical protein [Deltaproteobacteria bacterium]
MKTLCVGISILMVCVLLICGCATDESQESTSPSTRELFEMETVSGTIATEGEVDWYSFNAVETNRTLTVSCNSRYGNSPVDFMITVYERDAQGDFVLIFGKSAPEDAAEAAHLAINVSVDQPKELFFAVRDFMDDDASDEIEYEISAFYSDAVVDNSSFEQATEVEIDADGACPTDSISEVGEVNCYYFYIDTDGVYQIIVQYDLWINAYLPVNLGLELYDEYGAKIYEFDGRQPADYVYGILVSLASGGYYLVVDDQGQDDTSPYYYSVCVESVDVSELELNDTQARAEPRTPDSEGYDLGGSLEYVQDEDWYEVPVPEPSHGAFQTLVLGFHHDFTEGIPDSLANQTDPGGYQIEVRDGVGNTLYAHEHSVSATSPHHIQISTGQVDVLYVVVKPVYETQMLTSLPYQMRAALEEVSDSGETENGEEVLTILDSGGETIVGKIYKLGDVDNYQITVPTISGPRILEVYFDSFEDSDVTYTVHVTWDGFHKIISDRNGTENGADEGDHFKGSYYLPQTTGFGTTVNLQVGDDQNNDGSDMEYILTVGVLEIPESVPPVPGSVDNSGPATVYFDEPGERVAGDAVEVTVIEYDNTSQPEFNADTNRLRVGPLDINDQWQSDWVAGFVDYEGDRDIFQLIFPAELTDVAEGAPEDWYFDIQVQIYAPPGIVEYAWTLFRDAPPPNNNLLERTFWQDTQGEIYEYDYAGEGIVAGWADMEITSETIHVTVPYGDQEFWLGDVWSRSHFYLSIQDFNRAVMETVWNDVLERNVPLPNQVPDNDWGNTNSSPSIAPYYFQVTVTYHAGCSYPDDPDCAEP